MPRCTQQISIKKWANIDLRRIDTLPINRRLVEVLAQIENSARSEWVFANRDWKPPKSIRTAFETACRNAKLSDVTPHTPRQTFASRLGMQGAGDRTLPVLGRWKEPKMIRRYVQLSEQHLRETVERLVENSPTNFTTLANEAPVGVASKISPISYMGP